MKYNFYILANELIEMQHRIYGFAWNLKNEIQWDYNYTTGETTIHEGVAPINFPEELQQFLYEERDNIFNGEYQYDIYRTSEREHEISEILALNDLNKELYQANKRGKKR
jgi:hypothetical protein